MQTSLGARVDATRLVETLDHIFRANAQTVATGGAPTPICIWGLHGIGKTMIVEQRARQLGWQFAMLSPAQFEEMGDLNGLPVLSEGRTAFAPPKWVPTAPGPGVLLIDDINRADDRILRGLMQLLSESRLASWALPERWQIVATANPEGDEYSVTPMDDAILSRMMHLTLAFEARAWSEWARSAGVDPRGIEFVLSYPESVNGRRTTPRSLTQFFRTIQHIERLDQELELVQTLALSTLDEATAAAFLAHISGPSERLPSADEILDATDVGKVIERLHKLTTEHGTAVDRLTVLCSRLVQRLTKKSYQPAPNHAENLVRFLCEASLPADLLAGLHRDLLAKGPAPVKAMLRDKRVAKLLMAAY